MDPETWTTVPMQGSGTFAVEAVLQTVTPRKNGTVIDSDRKKNYARVLDQSSYMYYYFIRSF